MKPPYRVPSMAEIASLPSNGFTVASTFSGCGGSSLGYRLAGYRVAWANEFVEAAADTYRANFPTTRLDARDIRDIKGADVLAALGCDVGELDVLDGSPPCASFSTTGKREAHWGRVKTYSDTKQRTDDLFFEYARLVRDIQPRVFVAENVSGLVKGVAKGMFIRILESLRACGYTVAARQLDAQWLGVPQMRARLIFVGVRNDLPFAPVHPAPLPYRYSVRDALPLVRAVSCLLPGKRGGMQSSSRPCPAVTTGDTGGAGRHAVEVEELSTHKGIHSLSRPSPTVLTHWRGFSEMTIASGTTRRRFTIDELKRICAFPADFVLTGTYSQQWERLGRAVPPPMMAAVASAIRDNVLDPARRAQREKIA